MDSEVRSIGETKHSRIGFVENNNFMSARWERHFLLSEGFDTVSYNVDTPDGGFQLNPDATHG